VAVAGVTSQPSTYYFGATGGGIWKTTDSGATWLPVSDGQLKSGSVGALAVSESDPNVIYVGMGEACVRGNASPMATASTNPSIAAKPGAHGPRR
jgi:lipid-binding SYLF domain-containing protein